MKDGLSAHGLFTEPEEVRDQNLLILQGESHVRKFESFWSKRAGLVLILFSTAWAAAGCPVEFVAPYDTTLDAEITSLQKRTERFFLEAERGKTAKCTYELYTAFYDESIATIRTMTVRAGVQTKNSGTVALLKGLEDQYSNLRGLHEREGISPSDMRVLRGQIDAQFRSLLKLESLKRKE